jgi:hypothetical protein
MSVSTYAALLQKLGAPTQRIRYVRNGSAPNFGGSNSPLVSQWPTANAWPTAGAAPTTAVVPDRSTSGSMGQFNKAGSEQRMWLERYDLPYNNIQASGMYLLVDRLAHNGGLDATVTTAQSNGSWPALTRFTTGAGVWAAIEIYTQVGATTTTISGSYTNSAGTSGRTFQAVGFGSSDIHLGSLFPLSLQQGDVGVQAVASVTVLATTGTAGNFGVTLFKTLGAWPANSSTLPYLRSGRPLPNFGSVPAIPDGACLQLLYCGTNNGGSTYVGGTCSFFED